jgi:hypothetical protein
MNRLHYFAQPYVVQYTHRLSWTESYELVYSIKEGGWKDLNDGIEMIGTSGFWDNAVLTDSDYRIFMHELLLPGEWK